MASNSNTPEPKLSLPLKTRLQIAAFTFIFDIVRRPDYTLNRRLFDFLDRKIPANPTPRDGVSTHDLTLDAARNLSIRLFIPTPTASSPVPVIFYFHGGGFVYLSPASAFYDAFCRRLSRRLGAVVASVNYRLAPEHKFPAQHDDAIDVLRFLDDPDRRKTLGESWPETADLSRCFLAGDSAGGNMAHHAAVMAAEERLLEIRILGLVAIQPFFGGKGRTESEIRLDGRDPVLSMETADWMWKALYPDGLGQDHWACDVSGPNAKDVSGLDLPATMVVVGGFDPLQDRQRRYCEWLKENGKEARLVEYPNACHGFNVFPEVAEFSSMIDEIDGFVKQQMSKIS